MRYDAVIIGGGFYGCMIALALAKKHSKILILEREGALLQRASFCNQARVHGGYHYPRSLLTAFSSLVNFERFCKDFAPAIKSDFLKCYAIASIGSKTSAKQFFHIFDKMQAPISYAPSHIKALFCKDLIEEVFIVREYAFDSVILHRLLLARLDSQKIPVRYLTEVKSVRALQNGVKLLLADDECIESNAVYNCTYAGLNTLLHNSRLPLLPIKAEITEMALVQVPQALQNISVTIMDGAFFSLMPFPAKATQDKSATNTDYHTLSHVRYTPHTSWIDLQTYHNAYERLAAYHKHSHYPYMIADARRYMPILGECVYQESLFDVKIVSTNNEADDGRPILFTKDYGIKGFSNVLGGKIDNIYDILHVLD
ncbi:NAD(P)/FAD-dependent oxidoreductase [uncultured Helicobacter sp.]|uniref:NAD(P)/FAD-dependent oxidoreductase n=1 Tax=uncultured Helicobacter sp. TaxID=175537 RepID=UPI0037528918